MIRSSSALGLVTACLVLLASAGTVSAGEGSKVDAAAAFEQLKGMAGTWVGTAEGEGEAEGKNHADSGVKMVFEVSAAGTVVKETMMPGTEHEMINMYHMDGEDLVLTHYCAGGNQPTMKLDRSHHGALKFDFTGGTNLDPAVDGHIHAARLTFHEGGTVESQWTPYAGGKPAGSMSFTLTRQE